MHDLAHRFASAPEMPAVQWPVAARVVPKLQEIGKGLYEAAYYLGFADGLSLGVAIGIPIGVVATIIVFSVVYWAFFKPVKPAVQ